MNVSTYVVLRDGVVLASEENPVLAFRKCLECLFDFVDFHQQAFGPYGLPFMIEAQINAWSTDVENDYPDSEIASWHRALVLFLLLREKDPVSIDRNAPLILKKDFAVLDREEGWSLRFTRKDGEIEASYQGLNGWLRTNFLSPLSYEGERFFEAELSNVVFSHGDWGKLDEKVKIHLVMRKKEERR